MLLDAIGDLIRQLLDEALSILSGRRRGGDHEVSSPVRGRLLLRIEKGKTMSYESSSGTDLSSLVAGAVVGAAAGAIAVWAMDQVDWFAYNHESEEARQRTIAARPSGKDPAHIMVDKVAGMAGKEITQPHPAGIAAHYSLGIAPGVIYGALHE